MKFQETSPILWTQDVAETRTFYENVLGFTGQSHFPNFVSLERDHAKIMFIVPSGVEFNGPQLTGSIYFFMEDVQALWEQIKDKVRVKEAICDREYRMRDFSIYDNNGYEIVFGQDINDK